MHHHFARFLSLLRFMAGECSSAGLCSVPTHFHPYLLNVNSLKALCSPARKAHACRYGKSGCYMSPQGQQCQGCRTAE